MPRPAGPKAISVLKGHKTRGVRESNRKVGVRKARFVNPQSPSTMVAESYRLGGLGGTPRQRLDFFGQAGRLETLKKGLARLSPRMSRRLRKRSVEHMKQLRVMQEFAEGQDRLAARG